MRRRGRHLTVPSPGGPHLVVADAHTCVRIFRFVCNYTYFASLHAAARRRQSGEQSWDALFVHLPPLEVFPHDEQLRFVCCLLADLATIYGRGDCIADDDQTEL